MTDPGDIEIVQTGDGDWAVVRDGEQISVHPHEAGAEAARTRIAQGMQEPDGYQTPFDDDEGPLPDNVGS